MKRFFHCLLRRHRFERFDLTELVSMHEGLEWDRARFRVWYTGYLCLCGEPGYEVPR